MARQGPSGESGVATESVTAAEIVLRSLRAHGVEYMFANYGTDHTPLLEAGARARDEGAGTIPELVVCPHEVVAMGAAHGYAAVTGEPQAVIVHVDGGTQNLGGMVHNVFRSKMPVFVFSGLAPVTERDRPGARDNTVHWLQDVFDQPGIVRQYCKWLTEYRPPANPEGTIARALEQARTPPGGLVYVTATREALETPVTDIEPAGEYAVRAVRTTSADDESVDELETLVRDAKAPLVITSQLGRTPAKSHVDALVAFAETAGAGVVENSPATLCFPRTHDLHVGFTPSDVFEHADLLVLADIDVPWVPRYGDPPDDVPVVQVDIDPTKQLFPKWDFQVDHTVKADPAPTLAAVADRLDPSDGASGRETWSAVHSAQREERSETVARHRREGRFTTHVLSDALNAVVDDWTVVVEEAVTSSGAVQQHVELDEPGSYYSAHGAGLGWAGGASVGVKLANPDARVVSIVGDGAYVFGNPTASAWVSGVYDAPTLTVVYNNSGWNAVKAATLRQHPDERAAAASVPESRFTPTFDLTHAAHVVESYTAAVTEYEELDGALERAVEAVDAGTPAVLDVRIESV